MPGQEKPKALTPRPDGEVPAAAPAEAQACFRLGAFEV